MLVVGAGLGGLTFAIAWQRAGGTATVVERARTNVAGAGGIGLHPNAQAVLHHLGLRDRARGFATEIRLYADAWGAPTWAVHRADLIQLLTEELANDTVSFGMSPVQMALSGDRVTVTFNNGSEDRYDVVIGADGVRSATRRLLFHDRAQTFGGACFWRTTLSRQVVDDVSRLSLRDGYMGLMPLVGGRTHVFVQVLTPVPFADPESGRVERLRARFGGQDPVADAVLESLSSDRDIHFGLLEWVDPPSWGIDRVVLIGDAAHAMAPTLALGGAMAMEDGVVLAEELVVGVSVPTAISAFIQRRDPRVRFVQDRTRLAFERARGRPTPGEPEEFVAFQRRHFGPLMSPP